MELSLNEQMVPPHNCSTPATLEGVLGVIYLSDVLLDFLSTPQACPLRVVSRVCLEAVSKHEWCDIETIIIGSIALWRACFPRAQAACVRESPAPHSSARCRLLPVRDEDLQHLQHLRYLCLADCTMITAYGMQYLRASAPNMVFLDISGCSGLCDAAFRPLARVQGLDMSGCSQRSITCAAFAHLVGVRTLFMSGCDTITDAALAPLLPSLRLLCITGCAQLGERACATRGSIFSICCASHSNPSPLFPPSFFPEFRAIHAQTEHLALSDAALGRALSSARAAGLTAATRAAAAAASLMYGYLSRATAQEGDSAAAERMLNRAAGGAAGGGGQ